MEAYELYKVGGGVFFTRVALPLAGVKVDATGTEKIL